MVQGIGDPAKNSATLVNQVSAENSTGTNVGNQPAVIHLEQHVQPQVVQSQVTSLGGQRIAISSPLGGTVNVITSHSGVQTTTSSSGQSTSNATFQHYLIPGVSLGSQLQNITIPAQMALSGVRGVNVSQGQNALGNQTSTYTISTPQNLARILAAAASQNYSVTTTTARGVSGSQAHPQLQQTTLSGIHLQKVTTASGTTMITVPVTAATALHQRALVQGGSDTVAVRLTPAQVAAVSQHGQTLQLVDGIQFQGADVTKVHSYSMAKAIPNATITVGSVNASAAQLGQVVAQATMRQSPISITNHQQRILVQKQLASAIGSASSASLNASVNVHRQIANSTGSVAQNIAGHSSGSGSGGSQGPKSKRMRLEERPPPSPEIANMRKRFCEHRGQQFKNNKENYVEHLTELFFLQNGGNMMDYLAWKRRVTPQLLAFLKANALENDEEEEQRMINQLRGTTIASSLTTPTVTTVTPAVTSTPAYVTQVEPVSTTQSKPVLTTVSSHSLPLKQTTQPISNLPSTSTASQSPKKIDPMQGPSSMSVGSPQKSKLLTATPNRLPSRQHSISAVYDSSIGSQEEIVERAKQEAYVMQRVAELRKEGLWSSKRLPKVQEPPRAKAHWDYLLEEMIWLATDFAQERKWKKAAAKKCARMVMKYHQEKEMKAEKAEKEEQMKLRRIASQVAKEIKQFWSNIEKLVEFKQQTRLDEKRKKALDIHLNFIVDQTEKYSSWLTQGLMQNLSDNADGVSKSTGDKNDSESSQDEDFEPQRVSESDDEETIAKEEAEAKNDSMDISDEIEELQKEGEVPLEELINSLPPEILDKPATPIDGSVDSEDSDKDECKPSTSQIKTEKDEEYRASEEDADDDEATIEQEEKENRSGRVDYKNEIEDLQQESEMPIEKLYEKYAQAYSSDFEMPEESEDETSDDDSDDSDSEMAKSKTQNCYKKEDLEDEDVDIEGESEESEEEEMEDDNNSNDDPMEDIGMEFLIQDESSAVVKASSSESTESKGPSKEISDIAAAAEQFQPKGNTLSTTQVQTKVPFLLKHTLREYQHIGLDWLVAMQDRKLNGILADEMGLGKTIQTIALLAHLACEKGNWGPHLIVVPTSVMLNWEMELKKWCPGFKILTYYGTPKDRKQKRIGWTKPNAFHVCITSYKLVVQDHSAFRRKKWKYFILDEAQHIKNFKSQRWQMLLNFQSNRRLLLTGTPLQNSLMELWSLMHFLMPNVFQSHREFREWFVNPVTGMVEGNHEYNEGLIKRLHKILRPFLLRRLKCEVEKQLPQKYEHLIMCRLSTRQRYLYDDFMSRAKTKETLQTGNFLSVLNVLMQLRKVCNHPNLFESRPTVSPFMMEGITFNTASLISNCLAYDPFKQISLVALNLLMADLEMTLTAFAAHRIRKFQTPPKYVEEIDSAPDPPPRCPPGKIRLHIRTSSSVGQPGAGQVTRPLQPRTLTPQSRAVSPAPAGIRTALVSPAGLTPMTPGQIGASTQQRIVVMTSQNSAVSNFVGTVNTGDKPVQVLQQQVATSLSVAQLSSLGVNPQVSGSTPITVQLHQAGQGGAKVSLPFGFGRLVQTASGQHLLLTSTPPQQRTVGPDGSVICTAQGTPVVLTTPNSQAASFQATRVTIAQTTPITTPVINPIQTTSNNAAPKPVLRVAPLNVNSANSNSIPNLTSGATQLPRPMGPITVPKVVTRNSLPISIPPTADPKLEKRRSIFYLESLQKKKNESRKSKLRDLGLSNRKRCMACPIYGLDLIEAVVITKESTRKIEKEETSSNSDWQGKGYLHCLEAYHYTPKKYWKQTDALRRIIKTPESLVEELDDILKRFVFAVPVVSAPRIKMHVSHPNPSIIQEQKFKTETMRAELSPKFAFMHRIISQTSTHFPELRLIQYDCGKLQTLDKLLWQLKSGSHRVLIFTQMTRMLDILEQFLNFHGHTYLRLDGSTKVDQRQALMERFNADKRVFCFILSTRSGGIGINLTGADTVVFYDSDWNPTMDAQAQDRCHRIGQTRDVHIYRLISDRTIEENILKKANQKRLLGDLAIEGGNFTSAFFKKNAVEELFGLDVNAEKKEAEKKAEAARLAKEEELSINQMQFEHALGMAEEDQDVQAAKTAKAEAAAEFAEFDESIPLETDSKDIEEKSQAEEELDKLMCQLTPVEKYAITFLESIQEPFSMEQLKQAEEEIEAQKKDWELGRLKALKEEEERRAALIEEDEENMLTYSREDSTNQVYISFNGKEQMPIWAPPTPPQNENDLYIDHSIGFWYEHNIMSETNLPPIYVKKEAKRLKVDPSAFQNAGIRKQKVKKEEVVHVPRSMFDRPSAAILKMRREAKLQKVKGLSVGNLSFPKLMTMGSGSMKQGSLSGVKSGSDIPGESLEWLIHEDWAILQVIQNNQDLPLSLTILSPAHIPNWDLVADVVNSCSRIYRSPKQCKQRYETVIVPREEGKLLYDTNPKKQKKSKGIYKTKNNRPMKTSQLYTQDNNTSFTVLYNSHFETIKSVANKRTPTLKPWLASVGKNPKHAAVLQESGINYDQPLNPVQLAAIRHERISREKQKNLNTVSVEQQRQQQVQIQQAGAVAGNLAQQQATQAVIASLAQAQQLQAIHAASQHPKTGLQASVATVSLAKSLGNSIVVNAAAGLGATPQATFATIGKPNVSVAGMVGQSGVAAASVSALNTVALRAQRPASAGITTTMTVQEMVAAAAASGQVRALVTTTCATATSPAVVSVAGLTAAQLQAATHRINSGLVSANSITGVNQLTQQGGTPRNLTPSQLQALKHSALLRQQQQQQQRIQDQAVLKQQQLKRLQLASQQQQLLGNQVVAGAKVAVSVNSPLNPNTATLVAQQRVVAANQQQQGVAKQAIIKQTVQRAMTEAEVTQLLKRQQLQQQKQAVAAQILAQAQLQQQQQALQHVQQTIAGNVPVTPLVKTVTAPSSLVSQSVTIPVSAVTMAGVNINVALQQGKPGMTANIQGKTMTQAVMAQQQLRQLQLQQHLLHQRKLQQQQQQQKLNTLAHVAKVQGKTAVGLPTQLNTVQIVQQGSQQAGLIGQPGTKTMPTTTTMTVQQIHQVIKQVAAAAAQSNQGATAQLLPHAMLQANASNSQTVTTVAFSQGISPSNSSLPTTTTVQARIVPIPQSSVGSTVLGQPQTTLKQAIQVVTAAPSLAAHQQMRNVSDANLVAGLKSQTVSASSLLGTQLVTTSSSGGTILKASSPATVVVSGQSQTATLLQQLSGNSAGLTQQQVTLAVRASGANQAHPTQVQFQIQPATSAQTTSLLSQNAFASSVNQSAGTTVIPAITATENIQQQQLVHIVNSAMGDKNNQGNVSATPTAVQVVQAAIQAAKQQQQQQQQGGNR